MVGMECGRSCTVQVWISGSAKSLGCLMSYVDLTSPPVSGVTNRGEVHTHPTYHHILGVILGVMPRHTWSGER